MAEMPGAAGTGLKKKMHKELQRQSKTAEKSRVSRILGKVDTKITKAIHQHEAADHAGKKATKLHLKRGGVAEDDDDADDAAPAARLDRPGRARGGKTDGKHKGAHVNVIVAPQVGHPGMGGPPPVSPAAGLPVAPPPHPPMLPPGMPPAGMPPGAMPPGMAGGPGAMAGAMPHPPGAGLPGAAPMPPMMPRKRGGRTAYPIDDGAAGGEGRLEKARAYGKNADMKEGK